MNLSEQSKWYLRGNWPIVNGIYGHKDVHKDEMKELISIGLVREYQSHFGSKGFTLTNTGIMIREELLKK